MGARFKLASTSAQSAQNEPAEQIFVVEDTTATHIEDRTIDLYMLDHESAVQWGAQELEVFVEWQK
jgi:3D (Asp-Asp-Asp) domain-containing protein